MIAPRGWRRCAVLLGLPLSLAQAQAPALSIRGAVTDSVRQQPLAGARVVASRTVSPDSINAPHEFVATTDVAGRFEIAGLARAVYLVSVEHPWLDSTGFEVPPRAVDLRDGNSATVSLAVPSGKTIRSAFCPATVARDSTLGMIEGVVRDARTDQPIAAVRVLFAWSDFTVDTRTARPQAHHHNVYAVTARDGSYAVCGLPAAQKLLMQAQIGERAATGAIEVTIPPGGVLVESLRIADGGTGSGVIAGEVRRTASQRPVAGAHVHLFGALDEVHTAEDGTFRLGDVPVGTQSVEVTAVGMRPTRYAIEVREGTQRVILNMPEMPQALDTVRTSALRAQAAALRHEYAARARHGPGQYITEDMIAKTHPWQTTDLIRYVAGFKYSKDTVYTSRGDYEVGGTGVCKPTILIDGSPADSMNEVMPVAIHGIEVYASSIMVPLKYASSAASSVCGTILIWTK
jgi:hypothetical protein